MPAGPITPEEQAFFAVITNRDLLRYITNFHAKNLTDFILFNRPECYNSCKYRFSPDFIVTMQDIAIGLKHDNIAYVEWAISKITFHWATGAGWNIAETLVECIKKGHKNSFKWIIQNISLFPQFARYLPSPDEIESGLQTDPLLDIAARAENFEMMEFIHKLNFTQYSIESIVIAIRTQNVKLLTWLLDLKQRKSLDTTRMMEEAVRQDNTEIFTICYKFSPFHTMGFSVELPDYVAKTGKLEYMKIIYETKWNRDKFTYKTVENAARGGYLNILEWMHVNKIGYCTSRALNIAAQNGHLAVIKWIHLTYPNIVSTNAIYYAAQKEHYHVINWVFRNRDDPLNEYTLFALKEFCKPKFIEYLRRLMARPERHCPDV